MGTVDTGILQLHAVIIDRVRIKLRQQGILMLQI